MSELQLIEKIAGSQYVWAILCIIIGFAFYKMMKNSASKIEQKSDKREQDLLGFYKEQQSEAKEREHKLMIHLEKSNDSQARTADTLERIEKNLNHLESKVDKGFTDVWDKIEKIDK